MLAGPGVIVATLMMACFSRYVFPYNWDWNTCLYFGAMTSATDPVAVVALMKVCNVEVVYLSDRTVLLVSLVLNGDDSSEYPHGGGVLICCLPWYILVPLTIETRG